MHYVTINLFIFDYALVGFAAKNYIIQSLRGTYRPEL